MPVTSRRCGMITRREAERLCKSFLGDHSPPKLPENFAFDVSHCCACELILSFTWKSCRNDGNLRFIKGDAVELSFRRATTHREPNASNVSTAVSSSRPTSSSSTRIAPCPTPNTSSRMQPISIRKNYSCYFKRNSWPLAMSRVEITQKRTASYFHLRWIGGGDISIWPDRHRIRSCLLGRMWKPCSTEAAGSEWQVVQAATHLPTTAASQQRPIRAVHKSRWHSNPLKSSTAKQTANLWNNILQRLLVNITLFTRQPAKERNTIPSRIFQRLVFQ